MENASVLDEFEVDWKMGITNSKSEDSEEEIDVSIFGDSSGLADVVLIIEGTRIPVVKSVLFVASPVFKVMFTGDFAEKSQQGIELPGKDLQSFLSFLRCIYPDHRDRVTDDTVLSILPLASEYQVENLTAECEDCMIYLIRRKIKSKKSISCDETCKYLNIAERFHLNDLTQLCIRWVANFKLDTRVSAFECHEISDESKTAILIRACKRHEHYEKDVSVLITNKHLKEMITTEISTYRKPESKGIKSSKLRIAYKHFGRGSAEYKEQIEKLKTHCVTSSDDYSLKMPEDIIEDLRIEDE